MSFNTPSGTRGSRRGGSSNGLSRWMMKRMAASPSSVWAEFPDRKLKVTATELHGDERDAAWRQIISSQPRFAKYQQKTDRQLPVIRLSAE